MQVAIINTSGNVGKTTLAKHFLAPMLNAERVSIEDLNSGDGEADIELGSKKFKSFASELMANPDLHYVIDIGASSVAAVLQHFHWLEETRANVDFWVIPVTPMTKVCKDSIGTVAKLRELGIPPGRIVLIPNNVDQGEAESADETFKDVYALRAIGVFVCDQGVLSNAVFEDLKDSKENVFDVANDTTDFRAEIAAARAAGDDAKCLALGRRSVQRQYAVGTLRNLRAVFAATPMAVAFAG